MRKILVYLAHPRLDRSEIHSKISPIARQHDAVTFVDLYGEYPDFFIDVQKEQQRLREHDAIVFEHPVFWYSAPSLVKEWLDLVLEYGFAYGRDGHALEGKAFGQVVSAGSGEKDYSRRGAKKFTLEDLFAPYEATANLCGMIYLPPMALYDAGDAAQDGHLEGFQEAYKTYLDALANEENALTEIGKRDDIVSTIRNLMRV